MWEWQQGREEGKYMREGEKELNHDCSVSMTGIPWSRCSLPETLASLSKMKMERFSQGAYQGSVFLLFPETCELQNWQVKKLNIIS